MATSLLEKTRKINRLLQRSESVEYNDISRVLSAVLDANVYITNEKGEISGYALVGDFECDLMLDKVISKKIFPKSYVNWLMRQDKTNANLHSKSGRCVYDGDVACMFKEKNTTIVPIYGVGERMGTLIVAKYDSLFDTDDVLLAEYGATVIGMEMLRDKTKKIEIQAREKATVQIALATLSYSEQKAVVKIFKKLEGSQGELVASKIADEENITRSVIVNALRKFESAGVIEAKSLGMRGTHIKVKNDYLLDEIKNIDKDL
ncbi:MAG: GTP-sensing pleiotropic transcriptional regulator CodY [Selenomonadaceae bacterium]|nr:GTP-sensing pleiotropic transcriptional regulator CodY [Selenomonadaceae bacterium]